MTPAWKDAVELAAGSAGSCRCFDSDEREDFQEFR